MKGRRKRSPQYDPGHDGWARLNAKAAYAESIFRSGLGDMRGSIGAAENSLEILPTYAPAILTVASIASQKKDRARGRKLLLSLLDLPETTQDLQQIIDEGGEFLIDFQAYGDGLELHRRAAARFPNFAAFQQGRGCCAGHLGLHDEAIVASRAALALEPENQKLANDLGWSLFEAGQIAEALAVLKKAVAMDPRDSLAAENLRCCEEASRKMAGVGGRRRQKKDRLGTMEEEHA